jgi:hypothetical protein
MVSQIKLIKLKYIKAKKMLVKYKLKHLCITITTNTSKDSKNLYFAPLRQVDDILIFGIIVYSTDQLKDLNKIFDNSTKAIFVDTEKKIPFKIGNKFKKNYITKYKNLSNEFIEFGNLPTVVKSSIKNIPIIEFKPNDLTADHAWHTLRNHFKILSKKKIAIFGAGNIGFKLGLKLVESGVNVSLYRRNIEKCMHISNTINLIKPVSTLAESRFARSPIAACYNTDAIIACTNEKSVIKKDYLKSMKPNGLIIDLGKNNLDKQSVIYAKKKKIQVFRCDITETLNYYVKQNLYNHYFKSKKKNSIKGVEIVSGGYFGKKGSIIVNNCDEPKEILGVSDGFGNFKKKKSKKDLINIKKISKYF